MLSCGWYAEETSADSADALSVTNCKVCWVQVYIFFHSSGVCRILHFQSEPLTADGYKYLVLLFSFKGCQSSHFYLA